MLNKLIEMIQAHGYQTWVGLCVFVLIIGFALCAGNVRRQLIIAIVAVFWGVSTSYYETFYVSPIARYLWFPYWVVLEGGMILAIYYMEEITFYFSNLYRFKIKKIDDKELQQESFVAIFAFLLIVTDIFQLASALYGTGRDTAPFYDYAARVLLSMVVIVLVLPGKSGLRALKDAFNEKLDRLASGRAGSN